MAQPSPILIDAPNEIRRIFSPLRRNSHPVGIAGLRRSTRILSVALCVLISMSAIAAADDLSDQAPSLEADETQPALLAMGDSSSPANNLSTPPAGAAQPLYATIGETTEEDPFRFRRGLRERDLSIGYGKKLPFSRFDGRSENSMIQLLPRWGRFRNSRQEFLWEVPITYFYDPDDAYAAGLNLMFRHHFSSNRRFTPFVEIGGGFVFTNADDKIRELSGSFQFSPQAGIGVRAALNRSSDIVVAARYFHLSNAGTRAPNIGLNNSLFTVGYSRVF